MTRIEVYADIVCPFTHVGLRRLRQAREARDSHTAVRVRAWPLELINGAPLAAEVVAREVDGLRGQIAPELFAGFDRDAFPSTSLPAFGLAAAAYLVNDAIGEAVSFAVRDALFEEGRDIADPEVVHAIGCRFGITPLDDRAAEAAVRTDWERGKARGVKGSPHFFVAGRDWFCPSLEIHHEHGRYDIGLDLDTLHEFYATAFH